MSKTAIMKCTCKHSFQDKRYGVGKRVFNEGKRESSGPSKWRCTVCKQEKKV